jgi:hypothetical protein
MLRCDCDATLFEIKLVGQPRRTIAATISLVVDHSEVFRRHVST